MLLPVAGFTLLATTCGTDKPATQPTEFSVVALLAQVPESAVEDVRSVTVVFGDLDAASVAAGVRRPDPAKPLDDTEIRNWAGAIQGFTPAGGDKPSSVIMVSPEFLGSRGYALSAELVAEIGFSLLDVHSFIEYQNVPSSFTVFRADVGAQGLTQAMGVPTNNRWKLGGADGDFGVAPSAARRVGESLRIGARDGFIGISRTSAPITAWLEPSVKTLVNDPALAAIAKQLDGAKVYSAWVSKRDRSVGDSGNPAVADVRAKGWLLQPFDAVGLGSSLVDGHPVATLVYHHASTAEAKAKANGEILARLFAQGLSSESQEPFAQFVSVKDITVDGVTVIVTLLPKDTPPSAVWKMAFDDDLPFLHE